MINEPFYKKQSFWLNIWVWWVGLGIIQIILLSSGELLSRVGKVVGYLVPFFSSFLMMGGASSLFQTISNEFYFLPERMILVIVFSFGGVYAAYWYSKRIMNLFQRIFFNIIALIIINFFANFMVFAFPV